MQRLSLVARLIGVAAAVASTPSHRWPGHVLFGDASSRITIDVFGDFQCPDTAATWPTLFKLAMQFNTTELRIRYHMFEIVSHHNAYDAARAALATASFGYKVMPAPFNGAAAFLLANQSHFFNGVTLNKTRYALQQDFYALSGANFFGAPKADWNMVFNSDGVANEVRSAQTYAISKGVHGTPTFFVQDTLVPEASSSWTMAQWVAYLAKI